MEGLHPEIYSVSDAATRCGLTAETLRHYDRMGLVRPGDRDPQTGYRRYTRRDLVKLDTVRVLRQIGVPLQRIGELLEYDDLREVISFFDEAQRSVEERVSILEASRAKIRLAREQYARALDRQSHAVVPTVFEMDSRTILLSDMVGMPDADILWGYLRHFYGMMPPGLATSFSFEDRAGVFVEPDGRARMFAVCTRWVPVEGLEFVTLPAGGYLCLDCDAGAVVEGQQTLAGIAEGRYGVRPRFVALEVVVTGILRWGYQVQVYLGSDDCMPSDRGL